MLAAALACIGLLATAVAAAPTGLPGATVTKVCAAAGPYWPTETLAVSKTRAWLACKEQGRVVALDLRARRVVASVKIGSPVIAVALGHGSVWALDTGGTLTRISPGTARVTKRIALGVAAPYNIWIGAKSVWVADDQGAAVVRVAASSNRVVARIPVSDGPADMAFAGSSAWVIDHRDKKLFAIDTATNTAHELAVLEPSDAPERLATFGGSLWVTGRGTDLLKVDPSSGEVSAVVDIGASGIDVVADRGGLWVPTRSADVDRAGLPTMDALKRVSPTGEVRVVTSSTGRLDVHGLVAYGGRVWLADNTAGRLYLVNP